MKTEQQYIDLYNQAHGLIKSHSSEVLNAPREKAFEDFVRNGFPKKDSEEYKYTDVASFFDWDFGLNLTRLNIPVDPYEVFHCDVPNLSTALYFLVNDSFYKKFQPTAQLPESVFVGSLKEFSEQKPEIAAKYYGKLAKTENDGLVAFNTTFAQDGFVVYVPKNTVIEKPLQLVNILRGDVDSMANRRLLIIMEDNSEAKLLVCDHSIDEKITFLATQVTEIFVGENARFDFYEMEENSVNTRRVASTFLSQEANSNVMVNGITLHNGKTRNNYHVVFKGENAEHHLGGIAIVDKTQTVDNHSFIDHAVPRCLSNENFKYVLDEYSVGAFTGKILVRPDAQKTEAYQSNKNICTTREAKMYTKPQLEIYADDVKCSHGATIGQIDETALFYMRARGISEAEARMLLKFAFMADVIDTIRMEALKDRLKLLVEKRFRGELAKCAGCNLCN
ncbi:Fe-S cluster assembly protein SufD [Parabacteroides sp. FAFU027]|uniref:Fe-S cluster assembly protein SufD n=1 Tax=Parabacteroides sp. FAFU027 TaxID=2922715 RepID=UPI001FAE7D27|nr:Fe-S cluster assembly protein SufD [Parabacteroides sp. FAFU027]